MTKKSLPKMTKKVPKLKETQLPISGGNFLIF